MINTFKHGKVITSPKIKIGSMKCEERGTLDFISYVSEILCTVMKTRIDRATSLVVEKWEESNFVISNFNRKTNTS